MLLRQPAHQHHIEHPLHVPGVFGTRQQFIDEFFALVRLGVGQEHSGVGRGGNRADEVERDSPQEFFICAEGRGQLVVVGGLQGDKPVDHRMERFVGAGRGSGGGEGSQANDASAHRCCSAIGTPARKKGAGRHAGFTSPWLSLMTTRWTTSGTFGQG